MEAVLVNAWCMRMCASSQSSRSHCKGGHGGGIGESFVGGDFGPERGPPRKKKKGQKVTVFDLKLIIDRRPNFFPEF